MPIYEYKCTICDERFEVEQSMKDDALTTIPGKDHKHKVKKVFSAVGISFKGSGFYKNDARGGSKSSSSSSSESASSSSTSESKSDSSSSKSSDSSKKSDKAKSSSSTKSD